MAGAHPLEEDLHFAKVVFAETRIGGFEAVFYEEEDRLLLESRREGGRL